MLSHHKYFQWLYFTQGKRGLFNLITGLFIWLFLAFAQPFGISVTSSSTLDIYLFLIPIGMLWVILAYGMDYIARHLLHIEVRKNVLADLLLMLSKVIVYIHVVWLLRGIACDWECLDFFEYFELWVSMYLMIAIVYLPYSFYARYLYYHMALSQGLTSADMLVIMGEGKDSFRCNPSELMYIQADDNYSDFVMRTQEKHSLRSSLSRVSEQLDPYPQFLRTHRSFIINTQYFDQYHRSKGIIILAHESHKVEVAVSKSYKPTVDQRFTHPK
ncbi:MAG: LytTR family DNA-binding domain-containing protein [Cyclobacteriaceae bacterium]